jgi:hypothetical protein
MIKHEFNIFPEMNNDEYQKLISDLKENGFDSTQPIFTFQDKILDGWNRFKACDELQILPEYVEFEGTEIEAIRFVMRTNKRRNLTSSQWACIAMEAEEIVSKIKEEAKERQIQAGKENGRGKEKVMEQIPEAIPERETSSEKIANLFNTNEKYIRQAGKLKTEKPEIFEQVKSGEKTLTQIKKEEKQNRPEETQIDFVEELVSEMYDTIKRRFSKLTENQKQKAIELLIKKIKEI